MIQAWKKSHEFIRRHNWFCDSLDLDLSCIQLDDLCNEWCNIYTEKNYESYIPDPMQLVPAPKTSEHWYIEDGQTKENSIHLEHEGNIPCRPLAHLSIKDQTLGCVFLICLANIIETEQEQLWTPKIPINRIDEFPGVNYGNRLLCVWDDASHSQPPRAFFQWANVEIYRKYYDDYQAFVKRPAVKVKYLQKFKADDTSIAVVSMDLSKCYDRIIRDELVLKVEDLVDKHNVYDDKFLDCFDRFIQWEWADKSIEEFYQKENIDLRDNGIPQGLVISGFLSNIYLLEFDRIIKNLVDVFFDDINITIKDYCRYVDDMRFVIEFPNDIDVEHIKSIFTEFVQKRLDTAAKGQIINSEKTDMCVIEPEMEINLVEERIGEIKQKASGPVDDLSGMELLTLTRLVWNESRIKIENKNKDKDKTNNPIENSKALKSLKIPNKIIDVKTESIERFAAYTWRRVYRSLCLLICENDESSKYSSPCSRSKLDALTEDFCKQVVTRWLKDPSKVRIVKVAFDLFPHKKYLSIVIEVLLNFIKSSDKNKQYYGFYILSELYRSAATETGHVRFGEQLPSKSDIQGYRNLLFKKAEEILSNLNVPWYLAHQMILFLILMKDSIPSENGENIKGAISPEDRKILKEKSQNKYRRLYELVHSRGDYANYKEEDFYLLILAYKFTRNEKILAKHFPSFFAGKNRDKYLIRLLETMPD